MRKMRRAGLFAVCTFCTVVALSQSSVWKEYAYAEDGFAISFPKEPSIQKRTMQAKAGDVEAHLYFIAMENYNLLLMYAPLHPNDKRTPEETLNEARKGPMITGAKLISEKSISLGKYPGLEIETEDAGYHQQGRFYAIGRRMYALTISVPREKPFPEGLQRWYDSFRLVEPKK